MKLTTQRLKKLIREELEKMNEEEHIEFYGDGFDLSFKINYTKKEITRSDDNIGHGDPEGSKTTSYSGKDEEFKEAVEEIRATYDKIEEG